MVSFFFCGDICCSVELVGIVVVVVVVVGSGVSFPVALDDDTELIPEDNAVLVVVAVVVFVVGIVAGKSWQPISCSMDDDDDDGGGVIVVVSSINCAIPCRNGPWFKSLRRI